MFVIHGTLTRTLSPLSRYTPLRSAMRPRQTPCVYIRPRIRAQMHAPGPTNPYVLGAETGAETAALATNGFIDTAKAVCGMDADARARATHMQRLGEIGKRLVGLRVRCNYMGRWCVGILIRVETPLPPRGDATTDYGTIRVRVKIEYFEEMAPRLSVPQNKNSPTGIVKAIPAIQVMGIQGLMQKEPNSASFALMQKPGGRYTDVVELPSFVPRDAVLEGCTFMSVLH